MNSKDTNYNTETFDVVVTRVLDAPVEEAWKAWSDPAATGIPPGVPYDVLHVVTFEAAGDGGTEMTVTEYGYTTEQAHDLSKAGMEQCLDKMAAIFAG